MLKLATLAAVSVAAVSGAQEADLPPELFTDWNMRHAGPNYSTEFLCSDMAPAVYDGPTAYAAVAHPGGTSGYDGDHPGTLCHYERLVDSGAPVAVMINSCQTPFPASGCRIASPNTLDLTIRAVRMAQGELHYVFVNLEGDRDQFADPSGGIINNFKAIVDTVRSHHDDRINNAYIGNYAISAATYDASLPYPTAADTSWRAAAYKESGFNVSMPSCYPYSHYRGHATVIDRRAGGRYAEKAPTVRAALFWAPIERFSAAARALPEGHLIIPFVTRFIAWASYPIPDASVPTIEDSEAFIVHTRLRGGHGFYAFPSSYKTVGEKGFTVSDGGVTHEHYKLAVLTAWKSLDPDFQAAEAVEVLTLDNPKESGVFVSGTRFGHEIVVAISNLSEQETLVDLNEWLDLQLEGSGQHTIGPETHEVLRFRIDPAIRDFDGDGVISRIDRGYGIREIRRAIRGERAAFDKGDVDGDGDIDVFDERRVLNAVRAYQKFDELGSMR